MKADERASGIENRLARLTIALRSPIAFRLPGPFTTNWATAELEPVAITFEGWEFVWHPPMTREIEGDRDDYGPMVSVAFEGDEEYVAVTAALQRFFSSSHSFFFSRRPFLQILDFRVDP